MEQEAFPLEYYLYLGSAVMLSEELVVVFLFVQVLVELLSLREVVVLG